MDVIIFSLCLTAGLTCSRSQASAPPAPVHRNTPSPAPAGQASWPAGVTEYKSPTSLVWILGRINCTGTPQDYSAVHAMQDEISLVPRSSYGNTYPHPPGKVDPSINMKTAVRNQVNALDTAAYFNLLAKLMKDNPPAEADAPMVAKMAKIGIVPGEDFDMSKLDPAVATSSRRTRMDRWTSTCKTRILGRTRSLTGCQRRPAASS